MVVLLLLKMISCKYFSVNVHVSCYREAILAQTEQFARTVCSLALSRLNNLLFCFVICITGKAAQCSGKDYTEPAPDLIIGCI